MSTEREAFKAWADSVTPAGSPKPIRDAEIAWYAWRARAARAAKPATEVERLTHNLAVMTDALWKACGDDEAVVQATIDSQGTLL